MNNILAAKLTAQSIKAHNTHLGVILWQYQSTG